MPIIKISKLTTKPPKNFKLSKKEAKKEVAKMAEKIAELQLILQAENKHSILVVLQGMDASGKDGATRQVFGKCNPGGVTVRSFKKPSEEEMAHDFLWRVHPHAPEKGMINVFNRSHYEDVLIQRVHKWTTEDRVNIRYDAINAFERLIIDDNETEVLKFFLHLSKERQKEKLQERLDEPTKHWKHNDGDWKEHELWDDYMICYEDMLNRSVIPWEVVPSDQQWYRDYVIAKKVLETLEKLNPQYPPLVTTTFANNKNSTTNEK